jgi:hypothetical protein
MGYTSEMLLIVGVIAGFGLCAFLLLAGEDKEKKFERDLRRKM